MSKKLIIILGLIAIVAAGYWFMQSDSTDASNIEGAARSNLLNRVPADTVLFVGGLDTMPYFNPYDSDAMAALESMVEGQVKQFETLLQGEESPAFTLLMSLYMEANHHFYSGQVTEINDFAVYGLGVYPVVVWQSADAKSFSDRINAIEKEKNITSRKFSLGDAEIREYQFVEDAKVKLYLAINDNVISLGALSNNQDRLKLFAGVNFPAKNLDNTNKLQELSATHQLTPFALMYFDSNEAMKSLVSNEDNLLKQTITEIYEDQEWDIIKTGICFNDYAKITTRWPRVVAGYREFDIKSNPIVMEAAFIFEHTDSQFLNSLKSIFGTLPDYSFDEDVFSMGIGINIDNVTSFLTDLRQDILNEDYQCSNLIEMQNELKQSNPAMLSMSTQMVAGVQGVSIHATKIDVAAITGGDTSAAEGMIVVTAKNPEKLLSMASNFYPPLAEMTIEANGESQALSLPLGMKASVALSDSALTLQFGDSESTKSRIAGIHKGVGLSTGLFRIGMDFSAYFKMLEPMISGSLAQVPQQDAEEMKMMIKIFEKLDMKFVYDINVEDKGIVMNMKITMKNASNK